MGKIVIDNKIGSFFKDTGGNIAVWQLPNVPLTGWILFKVLDLALNSNSLKNWCQNLSMAFLFTWAYLEITSGSSYFRRLLGVSVTATLVVGYYKQSN